ncbi:uncharacterized [Tachysurus ichikawai]
MDCSYSRKSVQLVLLASGGEEQSRALIGCEPKVISQERSLCSEDAADTFTVTQTSGMKLGIALGLSARNGQRPC